VLRGDVEGGLPLRKRGGLGGGRLCNGKAPGEKEALGEPGADGKWRQQIEAPRQHQVPHKRGVLQQPFAVFKVP
jgi:hypothetical protein